MPTQILATGTTDLASADVVIAAGASLTVALKDAAGPGIPVGVRVLIQLKDDAGQYFTVDELNRDRAALLIVAAGTYRFRRMAGTACGVFSA